MRRIEMGGAGMEERYIKEIDPKEVDPGIEVVSDLLLKMFPNAKIKDGEELDQRGQSRKKDIDPVLFLGNEPAISIKATSELNSKARQRMRENFRDNAFVQTPYAEHDLPGALVYVDREEVEKYLANQALDEHLALAGQVLESLKLSLTLDLSKTSSRTEQEKISAIIAELEAKQQEIKIKEGGKESTVH